MTSEDKEKLIRHLRYNLEIGADYLITDEDAVEIIKALEQETVLDKIRAEIESCREDEVPHLCDYRYHRNEGLDRALDIIYKYMAESEDKEVPSATDNSGEDKAEA